MQEYPANAGDPQSFILGLALQLINDLPDDVHGFPKAKQFVVCAEFPGGSKFLFSQWKIYFCWFIDKSEEME